MQLSKRTHWRVAATLILGGVLATSVLAGCSNTSTSTASGPKGCTKVGVLLPETDTSPRWESKDHPLLDAAIKKALPGATTDFYNAANNKDTQTNQAETALTKGDCILVVAPVNAAASAAIVDKAHAQNVPVIAYDRLIQDDNLPSMSRSTTPRLASFRVSTSRTTTRLSSPRTATTTSS
jgi:D-xylose transport system substrate-binding protein